MYEYNFGYTEILTYNVNVIYAVVRKDRNATIHTKWWIEELPKRFSHSLCSPSSSLLLIRASKRSALP